jgi:hypothetical protein
MNPMRSKWVINFEIDQDIQVLSGDLNLDVLKPRLPNLYERYLATRFFNRKSEKFAEQSEETLAIWYFRAALSQFQGILDLVTGDIPSDCKSIWKNNEIMKNLDSHKLVSTMTGIRNLAVHTRKIKSTMQNLEVTFLPGGICDVICLMLKPLTEYDFKREKRVKPEFIEWFNRQATIWSANALLEEATFILMAALDNFVRMHIKNISQQKDALDKIQRAESALSCE